jgi:hypothetical protein
VGTNTIGKLVFFPDYPRAVVVKADNSTMDEMIEEGMITSVFDLVLGEVVGHVHQVWNDAGQTRVQTAGLKGIPQLKCFVIL